MPGDPPRLQPLAGPQPLPPSMERSETEPTPAMPPLPPGFPTGGALPLRGEPEPSPTPEHLKRSKPPKGINRIEPGSRVPNEFLSLGTYKATNGKRYKLFVEYVDSGGKRIQLPPTNLKEVLKTTSYENYGVSCDQVVTTMLDALTEVNKGTPPSYVTESQAGLFQETDHFDFAGDTTAKNPEPLQLYHATTVSDMTRHLARALGAGYGKIAIQTPPRVILHAQELTSDDEDGLSDDPDAARALHSGAYPPSRTAYAEYSSGGEPVAQHIDRALPPKHTPTHFDPTKPPHLRNKQPTVVPQDSAHPAEIVSSDEDETPFPQVTVPARGRAIASRWLEAAKARIAARKSGQTVPSAQEAFAAAKEAAKTVVHPATASTSSKPPLLGNSGSDDALRTKAHEATPAPRLTPLRRPSISSSSGNTTDTTQGDTSPVTNPMLNLANTQTLGTPSTVTSSSSSNTSTTSSDNDTDATHISAPYADTSTRNTPASTVTTLAQSRRVSPPTSDTSSDEGRDGMTHATPHASAPSPRVETPVVSTTPPATSRDDRVPAAVPLLTSGAVLSSDDDGDRPVIRTRTTSLPSSSSDDEHAVDLPASKATPATTRRPPLSQFLKLSPREQMKVARELGAMPKPKTAAPRPHPQPAPSSSSSSEDDTPLAVPKSGRFGAGMTPNELFHQFNTNKISTQAFLRGAQSVKDERVKPAPRPVRSAPVGTLTNAYEQARGSSASNGKRRMTAAEILAKHRRAEQMDGLAPTSVPSPRAPQQEVGPTHAAPLQRAQTVTADDDTSSDGGPPPLEPVTSRPSSPPRSRADSGATTDVSDTETTSAIAQRLRQFRTVRRQAPVGSAPVTTATANQFSPPEVTAPSPLMVAAASRRPTLSSSSGSSSDTTQAPETVASGHTRRQRPSTTHASSTSSKGVVKFDPTTLSGYDLLTASARSELAGTGKKDWERAIKAAREAI